MRTIAVINQKGGVGKTTTAVNVAAALARAGQRVLLVDLDPQAHATLHIGSDVGPEDTTIYDVLTRGASALHACRYMAGTDGKAQVGRPLALIPSHIDLVAAEQDLAGVEGRETILTRALDALVEHFDTCILDCPPSLGIVTVNGLAAADEVLIPLQAHFLALQGLSRLLETVTLVRDALRPTLRVAGVVLCMHESATKLSHEVTEDVARFLRDARPGEPWYGAKLFDTRIRRNVKLAEAPSFGKPIFDYAPESNGAIDYRSLAAEIAVMTAVSAPGATPPDAAATEPDEAHQDLGISADDSPAAAAAAERPVETDHVAAESGAISSERAENPTTILGD